MRVLPLVLLLASALPDVAWAQPSLTFSASQIYHGEIVKVRGTGFTPNGVVLSHLVRPDGTEYPEMPMKADAKGVVTHEITIVPNTFGTYELQLEDQAAKTVATQRFLMVPRTFEKPEKSAVAGMPAGFSGVWDGLITQQGASTSSRSLVALSGGRVGAVVGTFSYPGLRCGGELWLVSASSTRIQLGEVAIYGQDQCKGRPLLVATLGKDGALTMEWRDVVAGTGAKGTLKKRSE